MKIVNYFQVSLNLNISNYTRYHKPDNEISYIHKESNYPSTIPKQISTLIERQFSTSSSNETIFKRYRKVPKNYRKTRLLANFEESSYKRKFQQQQTK